MRKECGVSWWEILWNSTFYFPLDSICSQIWSKSWMSIAWWRLIKAIPWHMYVWMNVCFEVIFLLTDNVSVISYRASPQFLFSAIKGKNGSVNIELVAGNGVCGEQNDVWWSWGWRFKWNLRDDCVHLSSVVNNWFDFWYVHHYYFEENNIMLSGFYCNSKKFCVDEYYILAFNFNYWDDRISKAGLSRKIL